MNNYIQNVYNIAAGIDPDHSVKIDNGLFQRRKVTVAAKRGSVIKPIDSRESVHI